MDQGSAPEGDAAARQYFVPYPPVECLAVVGDRRAAAMVAADGTVCWMCLPRYDASSVFGALLDLKQGGYWRLGPQARSLGTQSYEPGTAVLVTRWRGPEGVLELTDCMLWPADARAEGLAERRVLLRRLRCLSGTASVLHRAIARENFQVPAAAGVDGNVARLLMPTLSLGLWCSRPMQVVEGGKGVHAELELAQGDEVWAILDSPAEAAGWSVAKAKAALRETRAYWRDWSGGLACEGARADRIRLSAIMVYLLTYAPTGAVIAAPTACLPERVPGDYNYDYRYCWLRDGSLTISLLAQLGQAEPAGRFLTWIAGLLRPPSEDPGQMPLQVLYRVDGGTTIPAIKRDEIEGYRSCTPVKFGNPVYQMREIDGFGFLVECALLFAEAGGALTGLHWTLVRRCVDFIAANWSEKDAGIWELMPFEQFVSTKVMCWVALDRGLAIARRLHHAAPAAWTRARAACHAEVMKRGWSETAGAFTQRYDEDALDATALLIPLVGFLPPEHPRVRATVTQVEQVLSLNGLIHRFVPERTKGRPDQPIGDREGAFLMCSFWLAQAWKMIGEPERAQAVLARAEAAQGTTFLFSEASDARHTPGLLGNMPLLFSQVAYARACRAIG